MDGARKASGRPFRGPLRAAGLGLCLVALALAALAQVRLRQWELPPQLRARLPNLTGSDGGSSAPPLDVLPPIDSPAPGVVAPRAVRAGSLGSFDRGRVYRVRASDVESVAGLWRMMAEEGPRLLHVSNLQAFVDSVPELRKQQADCLEAPDEEYYNRFTRYIPHMSGRGDTRLIEGMEPGMEVRDAHLRMFNVRTRMPQGYDERSIDAVRRDLKPDARGRVLHAGKVAGADATRRWFEKGHPIGKNCRGCALSESGAFYYPPKGFREWHTNKCQQRVSEEHTYREGTDDPAFRSTTDCGGLDGTGGWRAYVVYAAEDGQSWMSVVDGEGQIRSVPDRSGSINLFFLGHEDREATWHAIYSETHRWSVGFRVDEQWLNSSEGLLGQLRRDGATVEEFQIDGGEGRREGT